MTKTASSSTRAIKPRTQKAEESCRKPQRTPTTWFSAATGERLHSSSTTKRTTSVPLTEKAGPPPAPRTASTSPQRFSPLHRAFGSRGLRFRVSHQHSRLCRDTHCPTQASCSHPPGLRLCSKSPPLLAPVCVRGPGFIHSSTFPQQRREAGIEHQANALRGTVTFQPLSLPQ